MRVARLNNGMLQASVNNKVSSKVRQIADDQGQKLYQDNGGGRAVDYKYLKTLFEV